MENKINGNDAEEIRTENDVEKAENAASEQDTSQVEPSHHESAHHGGHHHHHHHHSGHHHHSSHHGHGKHRRHSHSSGNGKKTLNLNPKVMWAITLALFVVLTVLVIVFETADFNKSKPNSQQAGGETQSILSVEVINKEGLLVREAVRKYLLTDMLNPYNTYLRPSDLSNDEERIDVQVSVLLKLSTKAGNALAYKIELADNDRFEGATVSYVEGTVNLYEFKHLYTNTNYFYRVTVYTGKTSDFTTGSFQTADTPRILSIDGLSNVRDIGNWRTDSGKRIKQGLLIRGAEMDGAVERNYHLTNKGLADMLDVFGIKTDLDLRAQTPTSKDALGAQVEHRYYDILMYDDIFSLEGKEKIRMVFAELANPYNYPIYLHCTYGRDRTGTVCYILEALLGVSRGDCVKDYGLSNLNIVNIKIVEEGLKAYPGNTLKEQAESYLLSCGVSEYQIQSIRNIFLGD